MLIQQCKAQGNQGEGKNGGMKPFSDIERKLNTFQVGWEGEQCKNGLADWLIWSLASSN